MPPTDHSAAAGRPPTVLVRPHAGLCNRLQVVASARVLAEATGRALAVHWVHGDGCWCAWDDLYEPEPGWHAPAALAPPPGPPRLAQELDWAVRQLPLAWHAAALAWRHGLRGPRALVTRREVETGHSVIDPATLAHARHVLVLRDVLDFRLPGTSLAAHRRTLGRLIGGLTPVAAVRRQILELPPGTLGVHARRTDHQRAQAHSTDAAFDLAIDRHLARHPGAAVFVSSDDDGFVQRLRQRLGERVLTQPGIDRSRLSVRGLQCALADVLMLSRCAHLVGSAHSSFSALAADIGGLSVEVAGGEPPPEAWLGPGSAG